MNQLYHKSKFIEEIAMNKIDALIKKEMTPKTIRHWGSEIHNHVPVLINKIHGDGQCLLAIVPLNTRPDYYIMRINSSCRQMVADDGDEIRNLLDEKLLDIIEDQCGSHNWEDDEGNIQHDPFPTLDLDSGCCWEEI